MSKTFKFDGNLDIGGDNNNLVINSGIANGKGSIAGGPSDKSILNGLLNETTIGAVSLNNATANGDFSISLGCGTEAISILGQTIMESCNNSANTRSIYGFRIWKH